MLYCTMGMGDLIPHEDKWWVNVVVTNEFVFVIDLDVVQDMFIIRSSSNQIFTQVKIR